MANSIFRQFDTGAAAMAVTVAPGGAWQLIEVRLHLDIVGGAAENFTIAMDAVTGAVYDHLLFTQAMAAVTDVQWFPTRPITMLRGDEIDMAYANTNNRTWGLEVVWQGGI